MRTQIDAFTFATDLVASGGLKLVRIDDAMTGETFNPREAEDGCRANRYRIIEGPAVKLRKAK